MTTSTARPLTGSVQRPMRRSARTIESAAPGPWTRHALTTMRASGQRRAMTSRMSWRTAPESDVQMPIVRGYGGSGRLRLGLEEPLGREPRLERLEAQRELADADRLDRVDVELVRALRLEDVDAAVGDEPDARPRLERASRGGRRGRSCSAAGRGRPSA